MTEYSEEIDKVSEFLKNARVALVTTVGPGGELVSRPLAMLDRPFDGELYFFTQDPSPKTAQVSANNHVNVAVEVKGDYLSVAGTASVTRDPALIDELWNPHAEAWFEGGRDDPTVALLHVHADSAEYWTQDSPRAVALVKYAKAIVTGDTPDIGDNVTVDLRQSGG